MSPPWIGKYELVEEIGRGGFGRIYRAKDPTVGREVAIKILTVTGDPSSVARFRSEATAAGKLQHPNIVTIYEFSQDRGTEFLAMEFLDGVNFQQVINAKEPVPMLSKLDMMAQVARGLHYAHQHGVIHRDIKPANVMRLRNGSIKIMDFGIARITQMDATRLTQSGCLIGTVSYMAPELFTKGGEVDALCDIWAYGVVFYELLTGVNPFHSDDHFRAMYKITSEEPPPVGAVIEDCPSRIEDVIRRLLAKDRDLRYQSLEDVLFDIEPVAREIGQAQVAELLERGNEAILAGKYEEAQPIVRKILEVDPSNTQARQWREELRDRSRRIAVRPRIESLQEQANADAARRDYESAIAKIDSALRLDPTNSSLRARLEQFRAQLERVNRAKLLLSEARRDQEHGDLTAAFQHAQEAAATDPDNESAAAFARILEQLRLERDAQNKIKAVLNKSKSLMAVQAFAEAIDALAEALVEFPRNVEIRQMLAEAQQLRQAQDKQHKLALAIGETKLLIARGEYADAVAKLRALSRDAPGEPLISPLLSYANGQLEAQRAAAELEERLRAAAAALEAKQFGAALDAVRLALELEPANERARTLRDSIRSAKLADEEQQSIARQAEACRRLEASGRAHEALRQIQELAARYPNDQTVVIAQQELASRMRALEQRRSEQWRENRQRVDQLLADGSVEAALETARDLAGKFPDDPDYRQLLERATAAAAEKSEQRAVHSLVEQATKLAEDGKWSAAAALVDRALADRPGSQALREAAERLQTRGAVEAEVQAVERLLAEHDLDGAISAAKQSMSRHPGEARFSTLLERARERREFEDLLQYAHRALVLGDLEEAGNLVANARRRFGAHDLIRDLEARLERAQGRNRDLVAARQAVKDRNFDAAEKIAGRLLTSDPDDHAAAELRTEISNARQQESRRRGREQFRREVDELLRQQSYDAAIGKLETAIKEAGDDPELREDLRRVLHSRDEARRTACAAVLEESDRLFRAGNYDGCIRKLETALAQFGEDARLLTDLHRAREARAESSRKQALAAVRKEVGDCLATGNCGQAILLLESAIARFGGDRQLQEDLQRAREEQERSQRSKANQEAVREAGRFVKKGDFDSAIRMLEAAIAQRGEEPQLREELRRACAARDHLQQRQEHSGLLEEVRRLTGSRDYLQAITRLQAGLMRFPEDPVLLQELGAAKSASELAERRAEVDARIAKLEQLFRQGKAQEVKTGAGDLLQKYEEPRARELLAWANESLSKAKEIRRERTGRRRYPLWAGGLAAAVLSGGGLMFLLRPTVPPPPVTTPPNPQTTTQKPPVAPTSERSRHLPVTPDPGPTEPAPAKPKPKEPAAKFKPPAPVPAPDERRAQVLPEPVQSVPTPAAPAPSNPSVEEPVDCQDKNWGGLERGTITANSPIPPNGTVTIGRHRSPGLSGQFLPGCDVEIGPPQIAELITERPSSKNGFGRLVIQNKSEEAIPRLQVHWTIKKTIN